MRVWVRVVEEAQQRSHSVIDCEPALTGRSEAMNAEADLALAYGEVNCTTTLVRQLEKDGADCFAQMLGSMIREPYTTPIGIELEANVRPNRQLERVPPPWQGPPPPKVHAHWTPVGCGLQTRYIETCAVETRVDEDARAWRSLEQADERSRKARSCDRRMGARKGAEHTDE